MALPSSSIWGHHTYFHELSKVSPDSPFCFHEMSKVPPDSENNLEEWGGIER